MFQPSFEPGPPEPPTYDRTTTLWEVWEFFIKNILLFFCKREKSDSVSKFALPPLFIDTSTHHISSLKKVHNKKITFIQIIDMLLDIIYGLAFIAFLYYMFLLYFWSRICECQNWCLCEKKPKEEILYGPFRRSYYEEFYVWTRLSHNFC